MVYLKDTDFTQMSPGVPVGDAKTLETRGVPIYVDKNGVPTNGLRSGSVVYLDMNGYAVPFTNPSMQINPYPYGVVWRVDANTDPSVRDLTPRENQAVVVVEGVVPIVCQTEKGQTTPKKGDLVNPYGGVVSMGQLPVLGICDGTGTVTDREGKSVTLVAVRVNTQTGSYSSPTPAGNIDVNCKRAESTNKNSPEIQKNSWVVLDTIQPVPTDMDQRPRVLAADTNAGNKHIYGIAVNEPEGDNVTVRVYGTTYVPYVLSNSPKLAALKEANGGELPSMFLNRITYSDGRVGSIFSFIIKLLPIIGAAVDLGFKIYRMIKNKSSPAKVVDNVTTGTAKFHALLAAEGGKFDVEPDGYMGVFVNTGLVAAPTLTEAPVLLDTEMDGNQLIQEGRIYAGSLEGVRRITPENHTASSFFGVSAPYDLDDEEVNPSTKNGPPRIRVIREGVANVLANGDWKQGDYINYLGQAISAEDEEFVPHIGKAMSAAQNGNLGSVDIRAFNPNAYIVIDHVANRNSALSLNTMVSVKDLTLVGGGATIPRRELALAMYRHPHPGPLEGVAGVLTRFDEKFYSDGESDYSGRAIIQVGGYVKCKYRWDAAFTHESGIAPGGFVTALIDGQVIPEQISKEDKYMDIIGHLVIMNIPPSGEPVSDAWVLLNPRTVYIGDGN